mgnify:CR=1 FL=1
MTPGSELVFSSFFHEHEPGVRRAARGLVAAGEVDQLVASTFTTAWRRFEEIPAGAAYPWLLAVMRNHVRNLSRSRRRWTALVDTITSLRPMAETGLFTGRVDPLEVAGVEAAVARLTVRDQQLIRLAVGQEMQPAEIAEIVGDDARSVRVQLHRARRRLIQLLDEAGAED